MDLEKYNPFNLTALKRKALSVPMRTLQQRSLLLGEVLDYGCGHGDDVFNLTFNLVKIQGYDKYNKEHQKDTLLEKTYDVVTCNYVFNVIPDLDEHSKLIELLKKLSSNVYISVRADKKAIKETWKYLGEYDCWLTPKGSYQRFYDENMICKYFGVVEYITNNSNLKLFRLL